MEAASGLTAADADCRAWIAQGGIDHAIAAADTKLTQLLSENNIVEVTQASKLPPYIVGMMEGFEAFIKRHFEINREPPVHIKVDQFLYKIPNDGLGH